MKVLSSLDGASKVVQDANNRFVTDTEKSKLAITLGVAVPNNDLNQALTTGVYHYVPNAANSPWSAGYGFLHVLVSSGLTHDNANNWVTQTAYPLFNQSAMYRRDKVNADAWSAWTLWQASDSSKANLTGAAFTGAVSAPYFGQLASGYHIPNELGQYIDMHKVNSSADFDVRLEIGSGFLDVYNSLGANGNSQSGRVLTRPNTIWTSDSITINLSHAENRILTQNVGSGISIAIPPNSTVAFPIGTTIEIIRGQTGDVTIGAGEYGVTLYSALNYKKIQYQFSAVKLLKITENDWNLSGSLKA